MIARPDSADRPLFESLAKWTGRRSMQSAFEDRGYLVHASWQTRMIHLCGEERADLVNQYWDEYAKETIASAGRVDPNARSFAFEPKYRSSLLDELVASVDFSEPPFRHPPPIRCLFEYRKRLHFDKEFLRSEVAFFETLKLAESERLSVETEGWHEKKRDILPFLDAFARGSSFRRRPRNRYQKIVADVLVFEISVDLGGRPDCVGHLPLRFAIFHVDEPTYAFDLGLFERYVPGFDRYALCKNPAGYVLGIRAHVDLFDVMAGSFGERSQN